MSEQNPPHTIPAKLGTQRSIAARQHYDRPVPLLGKKFGGRNPAQRQCARGRHLSLVCSNKFVLSNDTLNDKEL
jgi:hypothetical protein